MKKAATSRVRQSSEPQQPSSNLLLRSPQSHFHRRASTSHHTNNNNASIHLAEEQEWNAFLVKWGGVTPTTALLQPVDGTSRIYSTSSSSSMMLLSSPGGSSSQQSLLLEGEEGDNHHHHHQYCSTTNSKIGQNHPHRYLLSWNTSSSSNLVSSVIHDAARITDWDLVLELCETNPEAASYAGRDGWTALHHACNKRCPRPDVISALITAYPEALLQEEEKAWLPLHYACRFKAPREVVRLLLHMIPESGKIAIGTRDRQGRRPLYYAIRYDAPPGVAGLLIALDPSAVLDEDQNEESPLALVWDSWAEKLEGKKIVNSFLPGGFLPSGSFPPTAPSAVSTSSLPEGSPPSHAAEHPPAVTSNQRPSMLVKSTGSCGSSSSSSSGCIPTPEQTAEILRQRLDKEPKLKKRWNQVNMLLRAAFGFPFEEDNNYAKSSSSESRVWRIVHATAAVKCHLSLFRLACALHPEQTRELDENDLRETMILQQQQHRNNITADDAISLPRRTHQTALHLAASSNAGGEPGKTVIYTLLSLYREAAEIVDEIDGSLPLHRMVENPRKQDWPNHSAVLYHFYERAVQIPDANGKLPLHRAARGITHEDHGENNPEDHSVIIQLVRAFPQAAAHVDKEKFLPFHHLCRSARIWDSDVEAVYINHRNALSIRGGQYQQLPLHLAAQNVKAQESLIQRLVTLHPRAASMEDALGNLPLHWACRIGKGWDNGVRAIYEAFPAAISTMEQRHHHQQQQQPNQLFINNNNTTGNTPDPPQGWYPLHMAAASPETTGELIGKLVELYAEASTIPDVHGRFPFHLACTVGKSWHGGLRALFDANPSALSQYDADGLLPLHICALAYCQKKTTDDTKKSKIKLTPKLEAEKDMMECSVEAAELDILFNIIRADPTTIARQC